MHVLRSLFVSLSVAVLLFPASSAAQERITMGPVPPPGTDRGWRAPHRNQVVITSVPAYLWHHGCGPTALGMIIGYWDGLGYSDLVAGAAGTQTAAVNAMIADDSGTPQCTLPDGDHYQDYSCPRDDGGPIQPDRSQTGGAHASDCVGDFMRTSWSAAGNRYGWSWSTDVLPAFQGYVQYASTYTATSESRYFGAITWAEYMAEIDAGRPVCLLVDTDGNGQTDHFIAGIGYNTSTGEYACRDTWDGGTHWFDWSAMGSGNPWGIHSVYLFDFAPITPGACCTEEGLCQLTAPLDCSGVFLGSGSSCVPNPCPGLVGACCWPAGDCRLSYEVFCEGDRVFLGTGTRCSPNPCPGLLGACCSPLGECALLYEAQCLGDRVFLGAGTQCNPNPCPGARGACCAPDGSCTQILPMDCPGSSAFYGPGTSCDPNPCTPNPNRSGSLLLHANTELPYPNPGGYVGYSGLAECADVVTSVAGAETFVFYVVAAFPETSAPRLASVSFGLDYNMETVGLVEWGRCSDFEISTSLWPRSGEGTMAFWDSPQGGALTEVYWFAGYSYLGAERQVRITPHPTEGAYFWDDHVPARRDSIVCLGALGFNTAGLDCCDETAAAPEEEPRSDEVALVLAGPNPVRDRIVLELILPDTRSARLTLIDVSGKVITSRITAGLPSGRQRFTVDAVDQEGRRLSSGVYYLKLESAGAREVRKLILVR